MMMKLDWRLAKASLQNFVNFSAELCELLCRTLRTSLQNFVNLTGVDLSVLCRSFSSTLVNRQLDVSQESARIAMPV